MDVSMGEEVRSLGGRAGWDELVLDLQPTGQGKRLRLLVRDGKCGRARVAVRSVRDGVLRGRFVASSGAEGLLSLAIEAAWEWNRGKENHDG